jgi:4,5-DOPA dioxygenase extradiol
MGKQSLPTVFISHGPPTLLLEDIPAREFLKDLGKTYRNVNAILCISAHWMTSNPTVNAIEKNDTIHDFYGFPPELYQLEYPASGSPELAQKTADLINNNGFGCEIDRTRGLDHGAWVPAMLMFPNLEVPILQLSIQQHMDPKSHHSLGNAIESLRHEGVLILGSGGAVHPLGYAPLRPGAKTDQWAYDFDSWLTKSVTRGDSSALINYSNLAPYPERAHPYPDHYMPLLITMGAAGEGAKGEVIHHSWFWGDMGMGAYEFKIK